MLSLYLHIPFCQSKCKYCAFSSFPLGEKADLIPAYLSALKAEIQHYGQLFPNEQIKTLYFGGGTPNLLGFEQLCELITQLEQHFDCSELAELSFEFNPYPEEKIFALVRGLQARYGKKYPRIRFSFGIQSFDNEVLQLAGRKSSFLWLVDFLRWLQPLKQESSVFNFDFIAFGKWNQSKKGNPYLWTPSALEFFTNFVESRFADSFSLYTLELFENQVWKKKEPDALISGAYFGTDEQIYEEFSLLKSILLDAGYRRYELSNFSLAGKSSIHNRTYWEMENYLGLGLNSSSFLDTRLLSPELCAALKIEKAEAWLRFKNTLNMDEYLAGNWLNLSEHQILSQKDCLIEAFFLGLRTDRGIDQLSRFEAVLVKNYQEKLKSYAEQGFLIWEEESVVLTDEGMDVFNTIVTELLEEI